MWEGVEEGEEDGSCVDRSKEDGGHSQSLTISYIRLPKLTCEVSTERVPVEYSPSPESDRCTKAPRDEQKTQLCRR